MILFVNFDLKNDKTIVIQGADKGSAVVVWEIHEEVSNDPQLLVGTIHRTVEKIRRRGDLSADNIKYLMVQDPKFARFYLLPKTH